MVQKQFLSLYKLPILCCINNCIKLEYESIKISLYEHLNDCDLKCDDVHHIKEQTRVNKEGFIGHVNQNHKYNLVPLCKEHHKIVHDGRININGFVATSKGLELHYTMAEENIK